MASLSQSVRKDLDDVADMASRPALPPIEECPQTTEDNEWKAGLTFTISPEGNLLSGGMFDVRPSTCFEFYPKGRFPVCWVRRVPGVKPRDDKVRKEKPLMAQSKAQDEVIRLAEKVGFLNTGEPAFCRTFLTYHQPDEVEMPFASKGLEAVLKAMAADKINPPVLEEISNTTLLVPHPSKGWEGVNETFVPRLLEKDVGLERFRDPCLCVLTKILLDQEFECRARLSDTLYMQTMLESAMVEAVNDNDMPGHYR